jgi:flagellum-specific ATP synthase
MRAIVDEEHIKNSSRIREILATYREAEDLINIGAYVPGSNSKIDYAISRIDAVNDFLRQGMNEQDRLEDSVARMKQLVLDRRKEDRE